LKATKLGSIFSSDWVSGGISIYILHLTLVILLPFLLAVAVILWLVSWVCLPVCPASLWTPTSARVDFKGSLAGFRAPRTLRLSVSPSFLSVSLSHLWLICDRLCRCRFPILVFPQTLCRGRNSGHRKISCLRIPFFIHIFLNIFVLNCHYTTLLYIKDAIEYYNKIVKYYLTDCNRSVTKSRLQIWYLF